MFTCRVDGILGSAAMFRTMLRSKNIIYSMLRCVLLSFNVAASSVRAASSPGLGHPTPAT